jgi:hypothetical protein
MDCLLMSSNFFISVHFLNLLIHKHYFFHFIILFRNLINFDNKFMSRKIVLRLLKNFMLKKIKKRGDFYYSLKPAYYYFSFVYIITLLYT